MGESSRVASRSGPSAAPRRPRSAPVRGEVAAPAIEQRTGNLASARRLGGGRGEQAAISPGDPIGNQAARRLRVGAPADPAEREADGVADRAIVGAATDRGARERPLPALPAARRVLGEAPSELPLPDAGAPLAAEIRRAVEPVLGVSLDGVRVHGGPRAAVWADSLGARAFTHHNHIVLGAHESPADIRLLAHEAAHVAQQAYAPSRGSITIQRQPNATKQSLNKQQVAAWTNADLSAAEDALLGALQGPAPDLRDTLESNLGVVQREMLRRGLPVKPYWGMRAAGKSEDRASAGQIAALQTRIDLLILVLQTSFPTSSGGAVARLQAERASVEQLHRDDVLREGDRLEAAQTAAEAIARVQRGLPAAAPPGIEDAYAAVQSAIAVAVGDIATISQEARILELQAAAEKYVDAFSALLITRARDVQTKLAAAPGNYPESNGFINGYARNGAIVLGGSMQELSTYQFRREDTLEGLKKLGDLGALAGAPLAARMSFLEQSGDRLTSLLKRGQALLIMNAGFASGCALMNAVTEATDQLYFGDVGSARRIREKVIVPLANALDGTPSDAVLASAQSAIASESESVKARIEDVNEYLSRVGTFIQIATMVLSLYGGVAAMEAAGGAGVTAQGINLSQFVRGSLAFTMGSQLITSGLTGQPITPQGFVFQAGMDLATLGLMHVVGAGLAGLYGGAAKVPIGVQSTVQFVALWGWSAGTSMLMQPGPITAAGAIKTISETGTHTAIAMLALGIGHRIGQLPTVQMPAVPAPEAAARQRAALAELEAVQTRGRAIDAEIKKWAEAGESPAEIERLMGESEAWYGSLRKSLSGLAEAGVIDATQAEALAAQNKNHIAEIRNVRDMGRLGLRETGESTVAYGGDLRNLDAFLGRLKRLKSITSYEPVGRGGIYKVVDLSGRVSFYYPEGPAPEAGRGMSLTAEALGETFPTVPADVRARAASALAELPATDATRVGLELSGTGGEAVLRWLASLGGRPRYLSADLLLDCARDPELLARLKAERAADLDAWHQTPFEKVTGGRGGRAFLEFLDEVKSRRGTLEVSSAGEASAITAELASASRALEIRNEMGIWAAGEPRKPTAADWVMQQQRLGLRGQFFEATVDGTRWILQVQGGAVVRAWQWVDGAAIGPIDVASTTKALRDGLATADTITDPAQKSAALEALGPVADSIAFLRRVRGVPVGEPLSLLDRVRPPQRPAAAEPVGPSEQAQVVGPELVPVTTRDVLITRHRTLLDRAVRQGALDDPLVSTLTRWNPASRKPANIPSNPTATLDLIERQLDAARDAAVKQYKKRFSAAEIERLKREAFGGREDFGDFLAATSGKHGITLEALRGLGYMTRVPPEGEPPIDVSKVLERARTAKERVLVLEQFAKIAESRPGGIPGAYRLLADMTSSKTSWRGGVWTLRSLARSTHIKLADVMAFEQTETMRVEVSGGEADIVRRYDVVLRSGQKLELKSWTRWFPETIRSQFRRDVLLQTKEFATVEGLKNLRWLFEGTPGITEKTDAGPRFRPMSESAARREIQKQMELGLEDAMKESNLTERQKLDFRAEFRRLVKDIILIDVAAEGTGP